MCCRGALTYTYILMRGASPATHDGRDNQHNTVTLPHIYTQVACVRVTRQPPVVQTVLTYKLPTHTTPCGRWQNKKQNQQPIRAAIRSSCILPSNQPYCLPFYLPACLRPTRFSCCCCACKHTHSTNQQQSTIKQLGCTHTTRTHSLI